MDIPQPNISTLKSFSEERAIEKLWRTAYESIHKEEYSKKHPEKQQRTQEMQCINLAYNLAKEVFQLINRDSGERYFEHLREVANIIISGELGNRLSIFQVVVAILHDIIEDTDIDVLTIKKIFSEKIEGKRGVEFGARVAEAVQDLSKGNWRDYISQNEKEFVTYFEFHRSSKASTTLDLFQKREITEAEREKYARIKERAKSLRNEDYFSHLESLTDEVLDVKFADRLHNLRTQWNPNNQKQVIKKVLETKKYFLPIAKKRNSIAYDKLCREIEKLEKQLGHDVEIKSFIDTTKNNAKRCAD